MLESKLRTDILTERAVDHPNLDFLFWSTLYIIGKNILSTITKEQQQLQKHEPMQ
jgi:hypothetical protein